MPLHQLVGWAAITASGLSEVSSAQSSGMIQIAANTRSTAAQNQLKYRARQSTVRFSACASAWRRPAVMAVIGHAPFCWRRLTKNHTSETARITRKYSIDAAAA